MIEHNRRGYSRFDTNKLAQEHGGIVTVHKDLTIYKDGTVTSEEKGIGKMSDTGVVWERNANKILKNIRPSTEPSACFGVQPYFVTVDGRKVDASGEPPTCFGVSPEFVTIEDIANRVRESSKEESRKEKPEGLFKYLEEQARNEKPKIERQ